MDHETTDLTLFVRTSAEDVARWNRQRIVDALLRETDIDVATAGEISREVEKQIVSSGINLLTTPLIRELVDAKLIERGLEQAGKMHARLGFPLYDVSQLILLENKENANLPHSPEGTNLILAEGIKREYALLDVFSPDVAEGHIEGDIHIHGLGYVDRPYSACQSLEYLKKFGLNLPHALTVAKPAKHAEVLLAHMVRFNATLQGHFAGVIAWDAVNFSFAPYLTSMNDKEVMQFAQMLIYEFSQLTSARGGQSMFTDIHLYWEAPRHLEGIYVIGPGGEITGKTYRHYLTDAQRFAWALLEVFKEGDARGMPFIFPRPLIHISESFFQTAGHSEFLRHICEVAGEKGNTCFVFDRGAGIRDSCGVISAAEEADNLPDARLPWERRSFAIQNVTLNLPRLAYKAGGDDGRLLSLLSEYMELAAKAHGRKRDFMEKLLSYGDAGPLAMLTMKNDGFSYLKMKNAVYLMGMTGLNELVHIHKGEELHHPEALAFGLKIIGHLQAEAERLGRLQGMRFLLEQTPAETTAYRFARLDLKYFSPEAGHFVKGNIAGGEIYYTNSTQLSVSAPVGPLERAGKEGMFHPLIGGGVMTNVWLGDYLPEPGKIADFVSRVFHDTLNEQLVFSPEFITCAGCGKTSRGLRDACPVCGATDLEGIARISQYFSRTSGWNKGKLAELSDRKKYMDLTSL
jgi:anaerobic ribonucleoside-triphosphate reductase